jgi:hypothetical protein
MCYLNHGVTMAQYITQADLGVRLLMYKSDVGLSDEQVSQILEHCGKWRKRYIKLIELAIELGREIDIALMNHPPQIERINALLDQRRAMMARAEIEYVEAWVGLDKILSGGQYAKLLEIYKKEFQSLPHPVLGTGDQEQFSKFEHRIPDVAVS